MKLSPRDNLVSDPSTTWALAGGATDPILLYSMRGASIHLDASLPGASYRALWFDPATGDTRDAGTLATRSGSSFTKPTPQPWLLLLQPE
jgi:hypothetical protein